MRLWPLQNTFVPVLTCNQLKVSLLLLTMGGGNAQKTAIRRVRICPFCSLKRNYLFSTTHKRLFSISLQAQKQAKEKAAGAGSQIAANKAALNRFCEVCKTAFLVRHTFLYTYKNACDMPTCSPRPRARHSVQVNVSKDTLKQHHESKHPKLPITQCFPNEGF